MSPIANLDLERPGGTLWLRTFRNRGRVAYLVGVVLCAGSLVYAMVFAVGGGTAMMFGLSVGLTLISFAIAEVSLVGRHDDDSGHTSV